MAYVIQNYEFIIISLGICLGKSCKLKKSLGLLTVNKKHSFSEITVRFFTE